MKTRRCDECAFYRPAIGACGDWWWKVEPDFSCPRWIPLTREKGRGPIDVRCAKPHV